MEEDYAMLDAYKELEPIIYGENALKYILTDQWPSEKVCFNMHWHDRMEILYVVSGCLGLRNKEEGWCLVEGQIAVFGPGQLHGGVSGKNGVTYHTFMFDAEMFCNATFASGKYLQPIVRGQIGFQKCIEDPELSMVLDRLVKQVNKGNMSHPLVTIGMIYEVIGMIYSYCIKEKQIIPRQDNSFGVIVDYVNEHYTEKITAKTISAWFGYNESYFCRKFKKTTGFSFTEYVQVLRIEQAQKLLQKTKEEIRVIAWKCGYEDLQYFDRCFRKKCGCSPTEFRKKK